MIKFLFCFNLYIIIQIIQISETLPDAITTDCAKCTPKQKEGSDKVTRFLIDNRPEDWERLEKIYDPEATYRKAYLAGKEPSKVDTIKEGGGNGNVGEKE